MTQDPPKREHWQHQQESDSGSRKGIETVALTPTPETAAPPARRPVELTTSSIAPPEGGLATRTDVDATPTKAQDEAALWTTEKVRMRKDADLASPIVTTLKGGQPVKVLSSEGNWRKVSAGGQIGWVRSDFLAKADDLPAVAVAVQRPKSDVGMISEPTRTQTQTVSAAPMSNSGALRPARAPQGGDCQCPYDLMLNGKQCGDHSAYAKGRDASCFF